MNLSMYFRGRTSILGGTAVAVLLSLVQWSGITGSIGLVEENSMATGNIYIRGSMSFWDGNAAMILLLFTAVGGTMPYLTSNTKAVFFDKICINAKDYEQKEAGIRSLGGIIMRSKQMIVVWNDTYFERLWCVFELACFTSTHGVRSELLHLIPSTGAVATVCQSLACFFFVTMVHHVYDIKDLNNPIGTGENLAVMSGFGAFWIAYLIIFQALDSHVAAIGKFHSQLNTFSVKKCKVYDESDRPIVEGCIKVLFGSIENFDAMIRQKLAPMMKSELTLMRLDRYDAFLYCGWHHIFFMCDTAPFGCLRKSAFADFLCIVLNLFVAAPLKFAAVALMSKKLSQLLGPRVRIIVGGTTFFILDMVVWGTVVLPAWAKMESRVAQLLIALPVTCLAWRVYNPDVNQSKKDQTYTVLICCIAMLLAQVGAYHVSGVVFCVGNHCPQQNQCDVQFANNCD